MLATAYTEDQLRFQEMRSGLHKSDPQGVLARNLTAAFEKRKLSARRVAAEIKRTQGVSISNKTVSNMLNGEGNPQLESLMAVARHLRIPLWQLMCPSVGLSHFDETSVHELLEGYISLSEVGRRRIQRNLKGEVALEAQERVPPSENADETTA